MEAACVLFFGLLFFSPVYEGVSEQHVSMAANIQGDDLLKFWNMRVAHEEPRLLWLRRRCSRSFANLRPLTEDEGSEVLRMAEYMRLLGERKFSC